jgi:hypothetical protein
VRLGTANPKSLLLGTALASTLIFSIVLAPTPAAAQTVTCPGTPPPGTDPIVDYSNANPLICNNTDDRTANAASLYRAIDLSTANDDNFVRLDNSGALTAIGANAYAFGIDAYTSGNRSSIDIENSNRINATSTGDYVGAIGIYASTRGDLSGIVVENGGIIQTRATALYDAAATGIEARAFSAGVTINNRASISAIAQETEITLAQLPGVLMPTPISILPSTIVAMLPRKRFPERTLPPSASAPIALPALFRSRTVATSLRRP